MAHAEGRPPPIPVTHRRMLALALPMTFAHATTPLLGFVGMAAVGRLGNPALIGAIALGAIIFDVLFWTFGSLRMATAGLSAQAVGRDDGAELDRVLARALCLAVAIGAVLILFQAPIGSAALALGGASPAVGDAVARYFRIRIFVAPVTLANYAILGSTLGRGRSGLGLVLQVAINLVNIGLTLALVSWAGLGVAGAAIATVLAEAAGLVLGLAILAALGARPWRVAPAGLLEPRALGRMLAVNRDVMIRTAALMGAFALFTSLGARTSDVVLAANAVLENAFLVAGYFLDGFATAAEILCGQAFGAGQDTGFRRAVRLALGWSFGFGLAITGLYLAFGTALIDLLSTSADVRAEARRFLPFAAVSPLAGAAAFAFDGVYLGATWTRAMRDIMLAAFATFLGALWVTRGLGNSGLWAALLSFLAMRGLGQAFAYPGLARRSFATAGTGGSRPVSPEVRQRGEP